MSHKHKRDKKNKLNSDNLNDIIAMSNDEDIKKKHDSDDNDNDDSDNDDSDDSDDNDDNDDNDNEKKKGRKIRKINDETGEDEFSVPKIKSKKAKPHRQSDFSKEEISEVKKSKAVDELGNKLNDLHQIQIALPYDQQPPKYVENDLSMIPKKKKSFWKRKQFKTIMKIIIYICTFIIVSVFVWKYIKAVKIINERNDVFNENKGMNGGDDGQNDGVNDDVLSDRVYGSIGNEKQIDQKKVKNIVRNRDSRGRFVKKGK